MACIFFAIFKEMDWIMKLLSNHSEAGKLLKLSFLYLISQYGTSDCCNFLTNGLNNKTCSQILLLRQIWTVNYYVIWLSNNLGKEKINTGISREIYFKNSSFGILIHILSWNNSFRLPRKKLKPKINNYLTEWLTLHYLTEQKDSTM